MKNNVFVHLRNNKSEMKVQKNKEKKEVKNKGKNNNGETIEEKPVKRELNNIMSETIANCIISKIISYVFTELERKKIGSVIGNHCYTFMKDLIDQGLSSYHLAYDRDDYAKAVNRPNTLNKQQYIFYNRTNKGINTWIEINEPGRVKKHRLAGTLIHFIKPVLSSNQSGIIENDIEQMQSPYEKPKKMTSSSEFNSLTSRKVDNQLSSEFKLEDELVSNNSNNNNDKIQNNKQIQIQHDITGKSISSRENNNSNRPKSMEAKFDLDANASNLNEKKDKDLNVFDIPNRNIPNLKEHFFPEREEDEQLRIDYQQMKKREEMSLKELAIKKKSIKVYSDIMKKNMKLINGQKYTFDSNGKVMQYKNINPSVLSNEFWWNKPEIKNIATVDNSLIPNKYVSYKHILQLSQFQGQKSTTVKPEVVEMNNEEKNPFNNNYVVRKPNGPVFIPSGSVFELITPETGVVVKEDNSIKQGDTNFAAKYNKTSIEQYSQLISQSNLYNSLKIKKGLSAITNSMKGLSSDNSNNESQPYLGYKNNIQSSNNPLIQNADQMQSVPDNSFPLIPLQLISTQINPLMSNDINNKSNNNNQGSKSKISNSNINEKIRALFDLPYPNEQDKKEIINNSLLISVNESQKKNKEMVKSMSTKLLQGKYNSKLLFQKPKEIQDNINSYLLVNSFNQNIVTNKAKWGSNEFKQLIKHNQHNDVIELYKKRLNRFIGDKKYSDRKKYYHSSSNV